MKISNYRQYRGTHTINLAFDRKRNVVIIQGENGSGKSNLMNAITWCLYDLEVHKEKDTRYDDGMPIINAAELDSLVPGQSTSAGVEIVFETDKGPWIIKRRIEGGKKGDGKPFVRPDSELTVIHPRGNQSLVEQGDDTQVYINKLLPPALRSFFFIDGEQLREFFRVSTPKKIAEAIDIVSQLALLHQASYHLDRYQSRISKSIKDTSPKMRGIQLDIEKLEEKIAETKAAIESGEQIVDGLALELHEIKTYLKNHNAGQISELQKRRESIERDIISLNGQIDAAEKERNEYLVQVAPKIYLKETIEKVQAFIEEKTVTGELPARIKETFVRELLEKGICICGNTLTGEAREVLEQYGSRLALSELSEVTIEGHITLGSLLDDIAEFPDRMDEYNTTIDKLKGVLESKDLTRESISNEIREHNIEEVLRKEERRSTLETTIGAKKSLIQSFRIDKENDEKKLESKKNERLRELSNEQKNEEIRAKLSLAQETGDVLTIAEGLIKTKIRQLVETNTQNNFFTLIRKKGAFTEVTIDDDYAVKVRQAQGYNVIDNLSAGEYLILGLSFMSALRSISGFQAPVIIDTPLGKIDKKHRKSITSELPKFLEGTQLILLVTPTEYDEQVKGNLAQFLLPENYYEIQEDESNTESRVVGFNGA